MASKTATASNEERSTAIKREEPTAVANMTGNLTSNWNRLTRFLSDVRSEMRKVVAPSRKEVETTTAVVVVTVFLFGLFFWVTDLVFSNTVQQVLHRLGGTQ
jgi:preprotein translocase subunit SecE